MFIVTLPPSAQKNPRKFALMAKRAGVDILEIRSDLTPMVQPFHSPLPLLVALKTSDTSLLRSLEPAYIDIDVNNSVIYSLVIPKDVKLILSFHDYSKTPSLVVLRKVVQKMYSLKPWMLKLATEITSYSDIVVLYDLQSYMNKKSIRSTVLGMGPKAHLTRILSPLRSTWTYATIDSKDASAFGQLPISFYRLTEGRKNPKLFGILGGPHITASLSPVVHNALFLRHNIDALYSCFPTEMVEKYSSSRSSGSQTAGKFLQNCDLRIAAASKKSIVEVSKKNSLSTMKIFEKLGIQGLSVTAPFKRDAFMFADVRDLISQKLGVANTLVKKQGKWHAYNTDVFGILYGYPELKQAKKIAILGAGGAVPAIIAAVKMANSRAEITVFARNPKKAKQELSDSSFKILPLDHAQKSEADIVICAISEDVKLPLPSPALSKSFAIDLRYGKITQFMKVAEKKKYHVQDGMPMLIRQALKQFYYFTGKSPKKDDLEYLSSILQPYLLASR